MAKTRTFYEKSPLFVFLRNFPGKKVPHFVKKRKKKQKAPPIWPTITIFGEIVVFSRAESLALVEQKYMYSNKYNSVSMKPTGSGQPGSKHGWCKPFVMKYRNPYVSLVVNSG